jgi:hypothetical protein
MLIECIDEAHVFMRGKVHDFPMWKEDLPIFYHNYKNGKERNWVAMNVGALITNEERMLECIHMKF